MRILVCIKHVPAMEGGLGLGAVNPANGKVEADGWFMNPLDQYALQYGLRLAEDLRLARAEGVDWGEVSVAVLSVGGDESEDSLRLALALGADEAFLASPLPPLADPGLTAAALAALVNLAGQTDRADLVICGRQASDSNDMQVPYRLAARLGMSVINDVDEISLLPSGAQGSGRKVRVLRREGMIRERAELDLPALVAVARGREELPRPTLPGLMRARKKTLHRLDLTAQELGSSIAPVLIGVEAQQDTRHCRFAQGETARERVADLLALLRADGLLRETLPGREA